MFGIDDIKRANHLHCIEMDFSKLLTESLHTSLCSYVIVFVHLCTSVFYFNDC